MVDMSCPAGIAGACRRTGTAPVGHVGAPGMPVRDASAVGEPRATQPSGSAWRIGAGMACPAWLCASAGVPAAAEAAARIRGRMATDVFTMRLLPSDGP